MTRRRCQLSPKLAFRFSGSLGIFSVLLTSFFRGLRAPATDTPDRRYNMRRMLWLVRATCVAAALIALPIVARCDPPVDFIRDVQPIFKESCLECHDAKKHKADLRFDNKLDALRGGESGK